MKELDTTQSESPGGPRGRLSSDGVYYVLLFCIIAAATFLRLQQLGTDEVWIDEAFTGFIALTRDWLSYLRIDNTPPLYYLLQRGWCGIVTCNEFGLRLSSALAGILFIPLIATFCRRLYGRQIALAIALAAAVSAIHVYYSQEARVYILLLTVLLLFLYLQWRLLQEGGGAGRGLLLFGTTLCALFLHYFAVLVIGTCLFVYTVEAACRLRRVPVAYFIAVGGALLLFLPWLAFSVFSSHSTSSELQWIAGYFSDKSTWQLPVRSITTFLAGPQFHYHETNLFLKRYINARPPEALHLFNLFLAFLFLVVYVLLLPRVKRAPAALRRQFTEFSLFVILPLLALLGISLLITPVYVVGRYDLIAFPAFLLLAGGMGQILLQRGSRAATAVLAVLFLAWIGMQAYRIALYREAPPYRELKAAVGATATRIHDGDGLLVATPRAILVWYYLELAGYDRHGDHCRGKDKAFTCRLFPRDLEQAPASQQRYLALYHTNRPSFDIGYFLHALKPGARVLLFLNHVARRGGKIELDPVGLKLVNRLQRAGYSSGNAYPADNLLVFSRGGG